MNVKTSFNKTFICPIIFLISLSCEKSSNHPLYVEGDGVFDSEGNYYETVIIGDQEWMAENLKTDLYCNGDSIPYSGSDVKVRVYDNDPNNEEIFGKLYNYQAVLDTAGLCPCEWHVPSELEYAVLIDYLGGLYKAMTKMKSIGNLDDETGLWIKENASGNIYPGTNISGFNALPAGDAVTALFYGRDEEAVFWATPTSGTDAIMYRIGDNPYVEKQRHTLQTSKTGYYFSIRCIKDL